jgi:hypothetical protein
VAPGVKALLAAVLLALAVSAAHAALPAPPFELSVTPGSVIEGEPVTIRIAPSGTLKNDEARDIYLALATSEEAAFLTEHGAWSPRPVPYARVTAGHIATIVRPWPKAWPPGDHTLALLVVPPSADPLGRTGWVYRPVIARLSVVPRVPAGAPPAVGALSLLAAATLAAIACVWWTVLGAPPPRP